MILIIEGLDRCGKSTLISHLRKQYFTNPKLIVHHASSPPKSVEDSNAWEVDHYSELAKMFHHLSSKEGYDIICDRFHLGAMVYGMKYRGLNPHTIFEVDRDCIAKGLEDKIALVLLTDYSKEIFKRNDGNSIETTIDEFEYSKNEFMTFFNYSRIPHKLHINITDNGGFENTLPTVTMFLEAIRS